MLFSFLILIAMKKYLLLIFLVGLTIVSVFSQPKPVLSRQLETAASGMSADRLKRIDQTVQSYINQHWLSGAEAIVYHNGKLAYHQSFGYMDTLQQRAIPKDAIFRIASQTKAITSTAIMILYEQGKLLLDDPISKYIPAFKKQQVLKTYNEKDTTFTVVPAKREVTIRDLLTHTSGIGYPVIGTPDMVAIYAKNNIPSGLGVINASLLDRMNALAKLPLKFQPGEQWMYGLNTDLLGCLVEVVSGSSLENFIR